MQLSKLTFSLASLVLISALVFATTPVMAASDGPEVTFVDDEFPDDADRMELEVKVTFDPAVLVDDDDLTNVSNDRIDAADLKYRLKNGAGNWITASAGFDSVARTTTTNTGDTDDGFTFTVDITDDTPTTGAITDARSIVVQVPADVATAEGALGAPGTGNQASIEKTYPLPPIHTDAFAKLEAEEDEDELAAYDLTITFVDGDGDKVTTALDPVLTVDDLQVMSEGIMSKGGVVFEDFATHDTTDTDIVYTVTVILRAGVDAANPVTIMVDPGFAKGTTDEGSLDLPMAAPKTKLKPSLAISLVPKSDDGSSFRLLFQYTKATVTDAMTETAVAVPTELDADDLKVTTDAAGMNDALLLPFDPDPLSRDGAFVVTIDYTLTSLPLFVTLADPSGVATINGMAADGDPTPSFKVEAPNQLPMFTDGTSATRSVMENTAADMDIGAPVTATDADGDTPTYTLSGTDMASFAIVSTSGQLQTKAALDYEAKMSYSVTVTADDGNGGMASIGVTIDVTNDTADDNAAPMFAADKATRSIVENAAVGTAVGSPVTADDTDTLTYSLSGTGEAAFTIDNMGQLMTAVMLDYEAKMSYSVTVTATDSGTPALTATIDVTINVTNDPKDDIIAVPALEQPTNVDIDLNADRSGYDISWTAPAVTTGINGYYVQYEYNPTMLVYVAVSDPTVITISDRPTSVMVWSTADAAEDTSATPPADAVSIATEVLDALEDTGLGFVANTVDGSTQSAKVGVTSSIQLPAATGGSGDYTYSLHVGAGRADVTDNANGLSVDPALLQLKGSPTTADAAGTMYYWRATDDLDNEIVELSFTVTVAPADAVAADPTVITIKPKSTNLDRVGTRADHFKIAPNQSSFELTVTHPTDPFSWRNEIMYISLGNRDYDRSNIRVTENAGTPTSWTVRIAVSNPNPVRSFGIWFGVYSHLRDDYQLATPDPSDPTEDVNIGFFRVEIDNEGPEIRYITEARIIPPEGGPFNINIRFNEVLKADPVPGNFTITNGSISDIRFISADDDDYTTYIALITPDHGVGLKKANGTANTDTKKHEVELRINGNLADKYGNLSIARAATQEPNESFEIKKATEAGKTDPGPDPAGTLTATLNDAETETTFSGRIAANGFATIGYSALPDLEYFLDIGGTIGLDDNDGTADGNSRTVVISEILWGLDLGEALAGQTKHQFIELYNTTAAEITFVDWKLIFTEGNVVPVSDIDQVSNRGINGWEVDTGDTGKSGRVTGTTAVDLTSAHTPATIVSMYRNINYNKVETEAAKATVNRGELVKGIPGGNGKGSWKNSTRRSDNRWIYSTPEAKHHVTTGILVASAVKGTPFRINEIGNNTGSDNDWVELHNVTDSAQSLRNYQLTLVTAKGTDTELHDFVGDVWDNRKIPAKGFVVISTRHPRDTDLAAGKDISVADDDEENRGASHLFVVKPVNLQDDGKFTLILRGGHGDAHKKQGTGDFLIDVVATRAGSFADINIGTQIWPLKATGLPHGNVIDGTGDEDFRAPRVYKRNSGNGRGEKQFALVGYTGVGYDRDAAATGANGGTPGYENGAVKDKIAGLSNADITISEIMVDTGEGRQNLAQWVELYNSSMTQAVNLAGWKIHLENAANGNGELEANTFSAILTLDGMTVSPNQTVLIATTTGLTSNPDHFPSNRVVNLWTTKKHRDALEMVRRTDPVLSSTGFHLRLADKDGALVDEAGNLDGNRRTRDDIAWSLPASEEDGRRSSMIRVYDAGVAVNGTMEEAWVSADATNLAWAISHTYYGSPDDYGTPGFRAGGPLPVSLSKFRPERLDDGSIVVRWVTESELDNAGFNILRGETKDGEFTKLNAQLIAGNGTTSERNTYEFSDTSAKPNVVYYYQIQDVSLDGDVTTLRVSRLKGHVSATGKLTTTWGDLKLQD